MASQNRHERQLMRQRGAGNRNTSNTDFGLNFGLGVSRQDRQRMRQRGAGRKVENVDFGFTFRNSAQSRRSSSRPSNSPLPNARRSSKTPGRDSRGPSVQRLRRSTSRASNSQAHSLSRERSIQPDLEGTQLSKSQRLMTDGERRREPLQDQVQDVSGSQRRNSSMFAIAEIADEQNPFIGGVEEDGFRKSSQLFFANADHEKENDLAGGRKPAAKRKKRKSIGQQSLRRKKRSSNPYYAQQNDDLNTRTSPSERRASPIRSAASGNEQSPGQPANTSRTAESSSGAPKFPPRRQKKPKTVVLVEEKRPSSEGRGAQLRPPVRVRGVVSSHEDKTEGERVGNEPDSGCGKSRISSPTSRPSPIVRSIEVDEASDKEYIDEEESPEPLTPAPARKGPKKSQTATMKKATKARPRSGRSTFPILTHRMVNIDALPTVQEEDVDSSDDDRENITAPIPTFSDRAAPNAVEVLAQICRETVETAIERMETNPRGEARAVQKRKRSALEAFGADLDDRLLDMSAAVEDRVNLEARVRKGKREKADLQARWIEVRKQRERIALKCDRVREEHWENEHAQEERWMISEAARKAELELDREPADDDETIEFMLRSVAEEVTNAHNSGGLLHRMQSVNKQLERMAGVLEGRSA